MAARRSIGDGSLGNRDRLRWRVRVSHIPKHNSGNTRWFLYRDHYCGVRQPEPRYDRDDRRPVEHSGLARRAESVRPPAQVWSPPLVIEQVGTRSAVVKPAIRTL